MINISRAQQNVHFMEQRTTVNTFTVKIITILTTVIFFFVLNPLRAHAEEGFFKPNKIPLASLEQLGLTPSIISHSIETTGAMVSSAWENICSGGFVHYQEGYYFVTAGHCLKNKLAAKLSSLTVRYHHPVTGHEEFIQLKVTDLTRHSFPYDFSIFEVDIEATQKAYMSCFSCGFQLPRFAEIRSSELKENEAVYSIGFPSLQLRTATNTDYDISTEGLYDIRVTLGKVTDANLDHKSFCDYSDGDQIRPETWVLKNRCTDGADAQAVKYEARDPVLTNTDMTYGMSGSPLFDRDGNFVGIGSTALSANPINYSSNISAVYVKARNLFQR